MLFSDFWIVCLAEISNLSIISGFLTQVNLGTKNEENFYRTFVRGCG